jgi:hypothetical protein
VQLAILFHHFGQLRDLVSQFVLLATDRLLMRWMKDAIST